LTVAAFGNLAATFCFRQLKQQPATQQVKKQHTTIPIGAPIATPKLTLAYT
jgi:hypothetical protein